MILHSYFLNGRGSWKRMQDSYSGASSSCLVIYSLNRKQQWLVPKTRASPSSDEKVTPFVFNIRN